MPAATPAAKTTPKPVRLTVLPRLAACVEMEDLVSRFENVAGRSAMVGFITALFAETVADDGLFSNFTTAGLPGLASYIIGGLLAGTLLALGTRETLGAAVQEAVITSLTARARSAASVSQQQLDDAVDFFFERLDVFVPVFDVALSEGSFDDSDDEHEAPATR